jgi:hypothetical protein
MNVLQNLFETGKIDLPPDAPPAEAPALITRVVVPPARLPAIACIAKRSYSYARGKFELADDPDLVSRGPDLAFEASGASWLRDDTDLLAPKPATDVVVVGSAYTRSPVREMFVAVAAGKSARRLRVLGERIAEVASDGSVRFSEAGPFERVELSPRVAYGGCDFDAQNAHPIGEGRTLADLPEAERPTRATWLYQYARNPVGRAFFIDHDRKRADGAALPLIEDPGDPLTTDRFFVPSALAWLSAPLPAHLGWVDYSWYPRCARLLGILPKHDDPREVERESTLADGGDLLSTRKERKPGATARALQGAAPGLAVERLSGNEIVLLENLHPKEPSMKLTLPGETPRFTLGLPKLRALEPVPILQTVRIDTDRQRISLTWCGITRMVAHAPEQFIRECKLDVEWRKR